MESASHILDLIAPDIDFVCMFLLQSICLSIFFQTSFFSIFLIHFFRRGEECFSVVSDNFPSKLMFQRFCMYECETEANLLE